MTPQQIARLDDLNAEAWTLSEAVARAHENGVDASLLEARLATVCREFVPLLRLWEREQLQCNPDAATH